MTDTIKDMANRFAKALQGDPDPNFAELFAPNVAIFHIYDEQPNVIESARMIAIIGNDEANSRRLMKDYDSDKVLVFTNDDGFIIDRTIEGTLPDGGKMFFPFATRATVKDGKIVRMDSYQDRQQGAAFRQAIKQFLS